MAKELTAPKYRKRIVKSKRVYNRKKARWKGTPGQVGEEN